MSDALGAMRSRVALKSPLRVADEIGGAAIAWISQGEVWAAIDALGASQATDYDTAPATTIFRVVIYRRDDVRPGWRVAWGARVLRVTGIRDEGQRRIDLMCEEEAL